MMTPRIHFTAVAALLLFGLPAMAQPPAPPSPEKYQVLLRYRITSPRDQHVVQYDALVDHLQGLKFAFEPPLEKNPETDREDRSKNYFKGIIAAEKLLNILHNPNVVSVLAMPLDFKLPEEMDKPVRVRLELAGGLGTDRQRELTGQVKALLAVLNFREAIGYDHHGYSRRPFTRIVGTVPAGRLELLLKDLRGQPAGWFSPVIPSPDLPSPLRHVNPIQVIEVLTDPEPIEDVTVPGPRTPDYLEKITPDLWALVADKGQETDVLRVELLFAGILVPEDRSWRATLQEAAPGIFVEGHLGQVVTALVTRGQVKNLASLTPISALRLPRPVRVDIDPSLALPGATDKALALSGLAALHQRGQRGQGVRLAIIDTDFRGWEGQVKKGTLPKKTRLVDLTTQDDPDLYPAPYRGNPGQIGHGTQCALAAALAAPEAELILIRIDAQSPYQIDEVVRYIRGDLVSPTIDRRRDELASARVELNFLRSQVLLERRVILENFYDETDLEKAFGFLGPVYGWVFSPRAWHREQMAYVERLDTALRDRNRRFFAFVDEVRALKGISLATSALVWNEGFAVGGASPLSRAFDRTVKGPPLLWFQAAGNTRGQTWSGLYHDIDNNGLMEFAPPGSKLKKGQWTTELNFLAWKPFSKEQLSDLPAGARVRIALQWREPHDPDYYLRSGEEDFYRRPLADLRLSILRQRDPDVKLLPADAFDLVAVSSGVPQRLEHQPSSSVYELVLETTLDKGGRYALRLERPLGYQWFLVDDPGRKRPAFTQLAGLKASGIRPLGVPVLPALEKNWELQTRLFVDVVDELRLTGRPVLADFATDQGSVASPGDARAVITVGAADFNDQPQPYSAGGPLAFAELARKPNLLAYDGLDFKERGGAFGTSVAGAFAAGTAAVLLSGGHGAEETLRVLQKGQGQVFRVGPR